MGNLILIFNFVIKYTIFFKKLVVFWLKRNLQSYLTTILQLSVMKQTTLWCVVIVCICVFIYIFRLYRICLMDHPKGKQQVVRYVINIHMSTWGQVFYIFISLFHLFLPSKAYLIFKKSEFHLLDFYLSGTKEDSL